MSQDISANNKRIAKNTLALYVRTFITMIVGLYTSRVMLQALGVENYGINAVVGGIVGMTSILTGAMSTSISRYITYALGEKNSERLKIMFSTSVNAQVVMAVIVAIILEIAGVWFLNSGANIPVGRLTAANWVLQCSIISLSISLISSSFNAEIVAHERMSIYAYVSIVDALLRLAICFIIQYYGGDRLILLAILQIFVALIIQTFYGLYCKKQFEEALYIPKVFDKSLLKELTIFSSWSILNNGAWIFSTQGVNMLINVFFFFTFNASRNIAASVDSAVQGFVGNFSTAFSPQITKSYAAGDLDYSISLVNRGTKFTLLLMLVFVVPICMEADTLLKLWLGKVPTSCALFLRLSMFESLAIASGNNLLKLVQANGNIKRYSIDTALYAGLVFQLCWIAFELRAPVWSAYVIFIFIFSTLNIVRYVNIKRLMTFSIKKHIKDCIIPVAIVALFSFSLPIVLVRAMEVGLLRFFIVCIFSVFWTGACCVIFGLTKSERLFFINKLVMIKNKIYKSKVR